MILPYGLWKTIIMNTSGPITQVLHVICEDFISSFIMPYKRTKIKNFDGIGYCLTVTNAIQYRGDISRNRQRINRLPFCDSCLSVAPLYEKSAAL